VQVMIIICLFTKIIGCVSQLTLGRRTMFEYTSAYHTVVKNGAKLKIITFSSIKFQKIYIYSRVYF